MTGGIGRAFETMSTRAQKILLVEDHTDTAVVFSRVLCRDGHQVEVAHTVQEAEKLCERKDFDLLLCDIELTDGTSFHLLERARKSCPSAVGIVISAHGDDQRRQAAAKAGFKEYIVKPVRAEHLRAAIERSSQIRPANPPPPGDQSIMRS